MLWLKMDLAGSARRALLALTLILLCGCHTQPSMAQRSDEVGGVPPDRWRADDARFSEQERSIIAATRHYLEQRRGKPVDGYFRIQKMVQGYEV